MRSLLAKPDLAGRETAGMIWRWAVLAVARETGLSARLKVAGKWNSPSCEHYYERPDFPVLTPVVLAVWSAVESVWSPSLAAPSNPFNEPIISGIYRGGGVVYTTVPGRMVTTLYCTHQESS